jgi:hypothetical protein
MFTFPKFHRFHPNQDSSGLIPPNHSPWPQRDAATVDKPIWNEPKLKPEPAGPTREERKAAARQEALDCLQDSQADNALLAQILRAKHNISAEDVSRAVLEAQAEIERGAKEDV